MMPIEQIRQTAHHAIKKAAGRNLRHICKAHHILLLESDMGSCETSCKGFFLQQDRIRSITINSALDADTHRIVLAHELGHAFLHHAYSSTAFHDFGLFSDHSQLEYEANLFAAELLLTDEAVCSTLQECDDFFRASQMLCVPPQILDFKLRMMKKCGVLPVDAPIVSHGDFLKSYTGTLQEPF